MKAHFVRALGLCSAALVGHAASAQTNTAVEWSTVSGGNGHWYQLVIGNPISWTDARAAAQRRGSHLVSLTSAAEDAFASQLSSRSDHPSAWVDAPDFTGCFCSVGPWVGGYQPAGASPSQPWAWIGGETWNWSNWGSGEPNGGYSPGNAFAVMFGGQGSNDYRGWADDLTTDNPPVGPYPLAVSYVIEWDADCNADGKVDYGQIQHGDLQDLNQNGIPDICAYKSYPVGKNPQDLVFASGYMFVANKDDSSISKINIKTGAATSTFLAGGRPYTVKFDGTYLWTANINDGTVSKLTTAGVLKGTYPVGAEPARIAYDGSNIWVSLAGEGRVAKISRSTGAVLGVYNVGSTPHGILFDGTYIWVVNGPYLSAGSITKLSKTGVTLGTFVTGGLTSRDIVTDGTFLYVSNYSSGTISKIRKTDGVIVNTLNPGIGVNRMLYEAHQLWSANDSVNTVTRFDLVDDTLSETISFQAGTYPVAIGFDGIKVWSSNPGTASVSAF